jgi:alpha-tubulin suppressor-like RCC1 family protein/ElaB/YqjD/DUF883 family membrane-anchored ribosome-binding protein
MKKIVLSLALLLSCLSARAAVSANAVVKVTRDSVLQNAIEPYLEAEDTSQQLNSTHEILVTVQSELESTQEVLSETDSLLESTQDLLSDTDSLLESTQDLLSNTDSLLESTQDLLSNTDSLLESTQDVLSVTDSLLESTQEVLSETDSLLESTQEVLSETDSLLESTQEVLSETDSLLESVQEELVATGLASAQDLMYDPVVPYASAIDDIVSRLGLVAPYDGVNLTDPLLDQINIGLNPYLQAALEKLSEYSPIKQISAGGNHTVVLLENGTAWATGYNVYGQLGIGSFDSPFLTLQPMTDNNSDIVAVSAGNAFTVVLKSDGTAWATGINTYGQLGDGAGVPGTNRSALTRMATDANSNISSIAAGGFHSVVLKSDGTAWATGYNNYGQLGFGTSGVATGTSVLTLMATETNSNIRAIAAGNYHTLVLRSDGKVWATGLNTNGQLGDNTSVSKNVLTLMATETNSNMIAIAGGGEFSILLKSDGTVFSVGKNDYAQLGQGSPSLAKRILGAMIGADNSNIKAIRSGTYHSVILKSDGTAWATGRNNSGQIGNGTTSSTVNVLTAMTDNNANISSLAAANLHTIALKSDGTVYGTGANTLGQLGDGTIVTKNVLTEMAPFLS